MAHDPTRSWPTGKGPDNTSIPGAAWLELLDGQAFPVVGAGAMVRDGNAWTPASSSNPVHVRAQALEQLIGALNATKETNPDAASASMLALLRGLIAIVGKEATLAQSVDKLNSILSRLEGKLDTAIFDSQGNPISAANRLPVDAAVSGTVDVSDRADRQLGQVALSGRSAEVIMPRAIRSENAAATVSVPAQARGVLLVAHIYGITGSFDSGQGLRLRMINRAFRSISSARSNWYEMQTQRINNRLGNVSLCIAPFPFDGSNLTSHIQNLDSKVASWILGDEIFVDLGIDGTFVGEEGFDCDVRALWLS